MNQHLKQGLLSGLLLVGCYLAGWATGVVLDLLSKPYNINRGVR